jgi:hypothetical protein
MQWIVGRRAPLLDYTSCNYVVYFFFIHHLSQGRPQARQRLMINLRSRCQVPLLCMRLLWYTRQILKKTFCLKIIVSFRGELVEGGTRSRGSILSCQIAYSRALLFTAGRKITSGSLSLVLSLILRLVLEIIFDNQGLFHTALVGRLPSKRRTATPTLNVAISWKTFERVWSLGRQRVSNSRRIRSGTGDLGS